VKIVQVRADKESKESEITLLNEFGFTLTPKKDAPQYTLGRMLCEFSSQQPIILTR